MAVESADARMSGLEEMSKSSHDVNALESSKSSQDVNALESSKSSHDVTALESPVTYGNVLGAERELRDEPITQEDASLMQSAEARTFGGTRKDGAASVMQAAAEENVKEGLVEKDAHSQVAEEGVAAQEIIIPGAQIDFEFVGGQPVMASVTPLPADPLFMQTDAVTIGDALEASAVGAGDRPVDESDARAIQSAVKLATGGPPTPGGVAAAAQSAAALNPRVPSADKTLLSDVLMDASIELDADKVVTQEDAAKVFDAEVRNSPTGVPKPGGVAAAVQAAADLNERAGFIEPATTDHARVFPKEDLPVGLTLDGEEETAPLMGEENIPLKSEKPESNLGSSLGEEKIPLMADRPSSIESELGGLSAPPATTNSEDVEADRPSSIESELGGLSAPPATPTSEDIEAPAKPHSE